MKITLKDVTVVLVRPENAANIGAVCRAMKNMGASRLVIVNPCEYEIERIKTLAVHSFDIFENCEYSGDLESVTAAASLSVGVTRRRGKFRKYAWCSPEELASTMQSKGYPDVCLVFGNERTGLTDEELSHCSMSLSIPANPDFPSLNLSHAVQIVLYELYKGRSGLSRPPASVITQGEAEDLALKVVLELERIGFFTFSDKKEMKIFFRDIFTRAGIRGGEKDRVASIFQKIADLKINRETK